MTWKHRLSVNCAAGLAACLLAPLAAWAGAPADDSGPTFSLDVEALFLKRADPADDTLWTTMPPSPQPILDANDFDFGFEPGVRGRLAGWLGGFGVELRGFWLSTGFDRESFPGTANCCLVDTAPVTNYFLDAGESVSARYDSNLHGVEGSILYRLAPGAEILGGVRWIDLDEKLRFEATGFFEIDTWETWNRLIGPQLGVRLDVAEILGSGESRFSLITDVRAAALFNDIHTTFDASYGPAGDDNDHEVGASVEAGLRAGFELIDGVILHAGYEVLWLQEVATATRQIGGTGNFNPPNIIIPMEARTHNVLYHGASVGLTISLP